MTPPASEVYEFGDFRVDVGERRLLRRDGTVVPLTPRVFETLRYLVEHSGRLLDKESLMKAVWPDAIVEENNLTQNISTLRRVFGDSPGAHRYIVTVPGRGYRFVPEVRQAQNGSASGEPPPQVDQPSQIMAESQPPAAAFQRADTVTADRPNLRPLLVAAAGLTALALAAFFLWSRQAPTPISPAASVEPQASAISDKSIAVLPFANLSDDKENAYFASGIQDDVLTSLAQIGDLKVISRTSVMNYEKPDGRNMREIGQALGVANVLEGSVRRVGNRVLVNVQLIDARTDRHIWAERYDRTLADSIGLQGELAAQIAAALRAELAPEEKSRLETKPTSNSEAYALYLQARVRETAPNSSKKDKVAAVLLYTQAIALDPKFALAYARRSRIKTSTGYYAGEQTLRAEGRADAEEALRLSPSLGEAHTALGLALYKSEQDFAGALRHFSLAAASSPDEPDIFIKMSAVYRRQGRWPEALAAIERAVDLDPRNGDLLERVADHLIYVRDWSGARAHFNRALQIEPNSAYSRIGLAWLEVFENNDPAVGRKLLQNIPAEIDPDGSVTAARWDLAMLDRDYAAAEKILSDFKAINFPREEDSPKTFYQGRTALARGDAESARRYFLAATPALEGHVRDNPEDLDWRARLGLLYAYMQRKDDALREGRRAVAGEPESQNAYYGAFRAANLALIYALVGEQDQAITLLERLLVTPGPVQWPDYPMSMTLADLRLRWEWDSLRSDPRFQKILAGPEPKTVLARAAQAPPEKSIAVLPFASLSADPENAYFAEGVKDEILTRLSKVADLKVISSTSTQRFKSRPDNIREIAAQLGVAYILEGSVQRSGETARVTVQLIHAASDTHVWAETYDREIADLFQVETEVAQRIATALAATLTGTEKLALEEKPTASVAAYHSYLRGRYFWNKRTVEGYRLAVVHFNRALDEDPAYARAYAGLADACLFLGGDNAAGQKEAVTRGRAALAKALELDDTLAEAHASLALLQVNFDWDWAKAEEEFKRALALNPNYATAHQWYGEFLVSMGRSEEGIAEIQKAAALDPLSVVISTDVGKVYLLARRYDEAVAQFHRALEMDAQFAVARGLLALTLSLQGKHEEAIAQIQQIEKIETNPMHLGWQGYIYGRAGRKWEAETSLQQLDLLAQRIEVSPLWPTLVYLGLEQKDAAFAELEKVFQERSVGGAIPLKVNPQFDPLRSDPRYAALLQRAHFVQE